MSDRFKLVGGILNIIVKDKKVLMFLRKNKFDAGLYSLPGGCLENGETIKEAAARELKEEVDIDVNGENLEIISSFHRVVKEDEKNKGWQSIEYILLVKDFSGTPKIMETDKSEDLKWFDLNNLPKNISKYAGKAIENYINNEIFSEIDY